VLGEKSIYALLKDRCLRRKYSPNVDKMLVEVGWVFSASSLVKAVEFKQANCCNLNNLQSATNWFQKINKLGAKTAPIVLPNLQS